MQQGNQLLLQVGRQFSECQSPEEAEEMLRKVKNFVEAGKPAQDERLQKISVLAAKLYGKERLLVLSLLKKMFLSHS